MNLSGFPNLKAGEEFARTEELPGRIEIVLLKEAHGTDFDSEGKMCLFV